MCATNSAAQVSTVLNVAAMPRCAARARTSASVRPVELPRCAGPRSPSAWRAAGRRASPSPRARCSASKRDDLAHVLEEPGIDVRTARGSPPCDMPAPVAPRRWRSSARALGTRISLAQLVEVGDGPVEREPPPVLLERAHRLLERLLERAADGHHLAHRLHLGGERAVGLGELLEGPARELHHAVVDGGLERGRRLARDVVADLVEACSPPRAWRRSSRWGSRWPWRRARRSATRAGSSR